MIIVVDYGLGNITSVSRALEKIGADVQISSSAKDISRAKALVLPGVGAFRKAMDNIFELGLYEPINDYLHSNRPFLGICLGLHVLFETSFEFGKTKGFGVIKGTVQKFDTDVKIPHMGWNQIIKKDTSRMFNNIGEGSFCYFDHSYYVSPKNEEVISARTDYGMDFVSAIEINNIWGVQFHPEKSSKVGMALLKNFIDYAC